MRKSIRLILLSLGLVWGTSCSHRKSEAASQVKSEEAVAVAASDCGGTVFCTMEFAPHVCQFGGQIFEGSNRCAAMREARAFACAQKLDFIEDKVSCEAKKVDETAAASPCEERTMCTREYMPHLCRFAEQNFSGSNRCEAINKARAYACEKGLVFATKDVSCEPSTAKKPAGK